MTEKWNKIEIGAIGSVPRVELKESLGLTGCEVSFNKLEAGQASPFVHHHRNNEETYLVLSGAGEFWLDGEIVGVHEGSCLRITPETARSVRASRESDLIYICIQAEKGSLKNYTRTDGIIDKDITAW